MMRPLWPATSTSEMGARVTNCLVSSRRLATSDSSVPSRSAALVLAAASPLAVELTATTSKASIEVSSKSYAGEVVTSVKADLLFDSHAGSADADTMLKPYRCATHEFVSGERTTPEKIIATRTTAMACCCQNPQNNAAGMSGSSKKRGKSGWLSPPNRCKPHPINQTP